MLSGHSNTPSSNGRVPIPERPDDDTYRDPSSDEEGDEAPAIVVLKEGKHMTAEDVQRGLSLYSIAGSHADYRV